MGPAVKLTDDLVIGQARRNDGFDHFVRGQLRYSDVHSTTNAMLASIFRTNSIIDLLAAKSRINHDWSSAQGSFDFLKEGGESLKVLQFGFIGGVIQCTVVSVREFFKGKVWRQIHFLPFISMIFSRVRPPK